MDVSTRGMLVGMVLGDGHVRVRQRLNRGKYPFEERALRVLHSTSQLAYCQHKADLLASALGRKVNVTVVTNGPQGRYKAAQFTISHPYFGQLRRWCYPQGVKTFSRRVLDMLTPQGVAIWYMDDGHARRNIRDGWTTSVNTDIATMCSKQEAETIVGWFSDRFGVDFNIRCDKRLSDDKKFFIQANTAASKKFVSIIRPHIPDCMLYKIAHVADLTSHECRAPDASQVMR